MASRRRRVVLGSGLALLVAVAALIISSVRGHSTGRAEDTTASVTTKPVAVPAADTVITVDEATAGRAISPGFLGLSLEFPAIVPYAGSDPAALDPVLLQLIRNLTPGVAPLLRIGGDTTDLTWWPTSHLARPAGVKYTLTPRAVAVTGALARALHARAILGIDLEANSTRVAAGEARALIAGIGRERVEALELGNEPELYGSFFWDGSGRTGRAHGYGFAGYIRDIARMARALPRVPLASPATGSVKWFPDIGKLLATQRRVAVVTLHRYPLKLCYTQPSKPIYPTIANLLSATASRGLADSVAASVTVSHARRVPVRIDEMNTISCGSTPAVSKSFASALWVLDSLFEMARVGVNGVNIHSYPGATYELFTFAHPHGRWQALVEPEYYGMLMFAQAAPPESHLVRLSWRPRRGLSAWATRTPDGRLRLVAINDSARADSIVVRVPGSGGTSTLERLLAPGIAANRGVTLGGQSFGSATQTGLLAGRSTAVLIRPETGGYRFRLPGASAALLTIEKS